MEHASLSFVNFVCNSITISVMKFKFVDLSRKNMELCFYCWKDRSFVTYKSIKAEQLT